jgi:hypothetical protein
MKKTLILVFALIVAAACAAPPTNREVTVDTNRNTNRGAETSPAITEADAIAKEKAIWDTIKQKDYDAFASMLADDELELLPEGVMDKAGSIAGVKEFEPSEVNFSDWKFLSVDKDAYVVVYTVTVKGKYQGKEIPSQPVRSSSAWVNRNNKWVAIYHQECEVKKSPPPAAKPAGAAKATSSPEAKPTTATTGPDPIANEKLVWDLFKSRNYDAFAELLAPEFIEVEPDNVYDKAGSVKGVAMFDASKVVLSDWKTVQLDDDASIVTYMAKYADGTADRHASLWADRNGKWLALFHHGGTQVRKPSPTRASPSPKTAASPATKTSPQ